MNAGKTNAFPFYLQKLLDKYKYVLLICLAGVLLMLWPQTTEPKAQTSAIVQDVQTPEALAQQLQMLLEAMEGVGKAQVLLTAETGAETAYAWDRTQTDDRNGSTESRTRQSELVTVAQSGGQSPVPLRQSAPVYRGAAIVCEGGGNAVVRLTVTKTVQSLTGIPTDRIVISKMK